MTITAGFLVVMAALVASKELGFLTFSTVQAQHASAGAPATGRRPPVNARGFRTLERVWSFSCECAHRPSRIGCSHPSTRAKQYLFIFSSKDIAQSTDQAKIGCTGAGQLEVTSTKQVCKVSLHHHKSTHLQHECQPTTPEDFFTGANSNVTSDWKTACNDSGLHTCGRNRNR